MSGLWPHSLFGRTALLLAGTLLVFSFIAWQAMVWTIMVPAAELTAHVLTERAQVALAAAQAGQPMPENTRVVTAEGPDSVPRIRGFAYTAYVDSIRTELQRSLHSSDVRISRIAPPSEIWVRLPDAQPRWLVMAWRLGSPKTPFAALLVLATGAFIVLAGAAFSAGRLTAPLANLAAAAARVAEGQTVAIETRAGPREVRSLAVAFQSMSHRLAELDEQRELMLGGISHDLRTPLARIRVGVELLETQDVALIDELVASVEEMDRMIGQFLHYVRANYREHATEAVLDTVLRATLAAHDFGVAIEFDLRADAPRAFPIECVRHTLINLVQNAAEYGVAPISVRSRALADAVEISVTDRGPGLSAAEWLEAVQPFHRLRDQPSKGHTGLGLALVDRLVRRCGGIVQAARTADGFTVTVRLPTLNGRLP